MMGYKQLVVTEIRRLRQSAEFAENEIAKIDLEHYERKYQPEELAELIIAWSANGMNTEQTIKILTDKFNGNHWENYGHNRVYFDGADIASHQGLEWDSYNSGNICSARLNGEKISNSECRRILNGLGIFKIWYDLNDNQFHTKPISNQSEISYPASRELYEQFTAEVLAAINEEV